VTFTRIPKFQTVRTKHAAWRMGMLGTADLTLVIGLNYAPVQAELDRVRNLFLVTLPCALLLIGAGGWVVAGRALVPLHNIAQTAERVTAQGLDQRIAMSAEDPEITRLIHVLNRMIDRLEASFRQAVRFSADASHELKTPLAIMQGELENALQMTRPDSPEQRVFANLLEEVERLKGVTRSLLLLAQADAGQLPLAAQVELEICNAGPGVPESDQARLFDRFYRVDTARSREVEGAGLGLSLAREIARAHGGTLRLKESRSGRTCFVLTLTGLRPGLPDQAHTS
jgi:signal transduction histidine kinase